MRDLWDVVVFLMKSSPQIFSFEEIYDKLEEGGKKVNRKTLRIYLKRAIERGLIIEQRKNKRVIHYQAGNLPREGEIPPKLRKVILERKSLEETYENNILYNLLHNLMEIRLGLGEQNEIPLSNRTARYLAQMSESLLVNVFLNNPDVWSLLKSQTNMRFHITIDADLTQNRKAIEKVQQYKVQCMSEGRFISARRYNPWDVSISNPSEIINTPFVFVGSKDIEISGNIYRKVPLFRQNFEEEAKTCVSIIGGVAMTEEERALLEKRLSDTAKAETWDRQKIIEYEHEYYETKRARFLPLIAEETKRVQKDPKRMEALERFRENLVSKFVSFNFKSVDEELKYDERSGEYHPYNECYEVWLNYQKKSRLILDQLWRSGISKEEYERKARELDQNNPVHYDFNADGKKGFWYKEPKAPEAEIEGLKRG